MAGQFSIKNSLFLTGFGLLWTTGRESIPLPTQKGIVLGLFLCARPVI